VPIIIKDNIQATPEIISRSLLAASILETTARLCRLQKHLVPIHPLETADLLNANKSSSQNDKIHHLIANHLHPTTYSITEKNGREYQRYDPHLWQNMIGELLLKSLCLRGQDLEPRRIYDYLKPANSQHSP